MDHDNEHEPTTAAWEKYTGETYSAKILILTVVTGIAVFLVTTENVFGCLSQWMWLFARRTLAAFVLAIKPPNSEDKLVKFGLSIIFVTALLNLSWIAVQFTCLPVTNSSALAAIAFGCCTLSPIVASKAMSLPECHRQTINLIVVCRTVIISLYPMCGTSSEAVLVVVTVFGTEILGSIFHSKRQVWDLNGLKHTLNITMSIDMESLLAVDGDVLGVTGYTTNEFVRLRPMRDFLSPKANSDRVLSFLTSVINSDHPLSEVIIPFVHKDGHTIWFRVCQGSRVIHSENRTKRELLLVCREASNTILVNDGVAADRDGSAPRVDSAPALMFEMVLDTTKGTRCLRTVNAECENIFGLTASEMTSSSNWMAMMHSDDIEAYEASIQESSANMQRCDLNFRVVVDDKVKHLHGAALPQREGGNVVWYVVMQDITAQHNAWETTKNREIKKAIAARLKAASNYLSHEIRNQLYPSTMIIEQMQSSQSKEHTDVLLRANKAVHVILERVSNFSKWESGEVPCVVKPFSVRKLFRNIAAYAADNNVDADGHDTVDASVLVNADEGMLDQAATMLIQKALQFGDGKPVSVEMSFETKTSDEGVVVIVVEDQGRGMTKEQLDKAMVPFAQLRKADEVCSGTALVVPLTKAMVELGHQGTLTLTSEGSGRGTKATVRVPVQYTCHEESKSTVTTPVHEPLWWVAPHPGATADILVVDDVRMNRMMTIFTARKLGLTCHEASNGEEAVQMLRNNTYSVVFMDRQMPVMNGDLATEKARANGYTLPIVMVSADTLRPSEEEKMVEQGVTAFLGKMAVPGTRHAMMKLKKLRAQQDLTRV